MPERLLICTSIALAMKPRGREAPRRSANVQGEGPNWILIAGSALLSTLSIRLGYKLKQVLDAKQLDTNSPSLKGSRNVADIKQHVNGQMMSEPEMALPLMTVPSSEFNKENGVIWSSSPDRLELPQKPFHQSNSSESPCVSESGSDIFSKREVIQKLRQQLKRRDDMIIEMQDQIADMQNSLAAQVSHSSHLQSLLDSANRDLFDSEREVQRLRKAIADRCVEHANSSEKLPSVPLWPAEGTNGHTNNGYPEVESSIESSEKGRDDSKIDMLKMEVSELKEVIEGKDYLLQNYKEQKSELSVKIKELQQRLDSQLPNIF